jgi:hypothetical protein
VMAGLELEVGHSGRMLAVQSGSTITNGSSALRLENPVARDGRWGAAGWSGINVPLEAFGGSPGTQTFLPDYLVRTWRHVPFEWSPVPGGSLVERYVWSADFRHLRREVRTAQRVWV